MARIQPIDLDQAEGKAKALLENVSKALGMVPNLMRTLAHSAAALEAYLGFGKALHGGLLSAVLREQIALTVANANACEYCASAHAALGKRFGLDATELKRNLQALSSDPKVEAALQFVRAVVVRQGWVTDDELQRVRQAGFSDGEINEIIATTAITIFSTYFNHVAETEVDFPAVELAAAAAT